MATKTKKQDKKEEKPSEKLISLPTRVRTFEGFVTKKFEKRVVVEFLRTVFVQKYERFYKKKTKIHARLPENLQVEVGDYIQVKECRPLSKIIHFLVVKVVRKVGEEKQ